MRRASRIAILASVVQCLASAIDAGESIPAASIVQELKSSDDFLRWLERMIPNHFSVGELDERQRLSLQMELAHRIDDHSKKRWQNGLSMLLKTSAHIIQRDAAEIALMTG